MNVDPTQTGLLSAPTAKRTAASFARRPDAAPIERAPATEAAKRPSILPLPTTTAGPPDAPPSFPSTTVGPPFGDPKDLSVDGLLEAWGKNDPRYDLNGDGTVDMKDLLALLSERAHDGKPSEGDLVSYPLATDVRSADAPRERPADPPTDVAATAARPRETVAAPVTLVSRPGPTPESAPPSGQVREAPPETLDRAPAHDLGRRLVEDKARFLFEQLERHGFHERPPHNIHALVDALDFTPPDRESLIDRLEERYPRGLGLDTLA